jgi:xanthine dehydrogenase accessory factor
MCPSKGTMDIFVEPVLPRPALVVLGSSPVALALAEQARPLGYHVVLAAPLADLAAMPEVDELFDGFRFEAPRKARLFVVVSTQGKGDEAALRAALGIEAEYRGFVGSRRKMASLRDKLAGEGIPAALLDGVEAPAGLDLGAITPEEIALSILAGLTALRRRGDRVAPTHRPETEKA